MYAIYLILIKEEIKGKTAGFYQYHRTYILARTVQFAAAIILSWAA